MLLSEEIQPTRQNLAISKAKLISSLKGHEILKQKTDSMRNRYRLLTSEVNMIKAEFFNVAIDAYFSVTQANYCAGNFHHTLLEAPTMYPSLKVHLFPENFCGVQLPHISLYNVSAVSIKFNALKLFTLYFL